MVTDMGRTRTAFDMDTGPRENLEDALGVLELILAGLAVVEALLLVICDGVGGNLYGERASNSAVATIRSKLTALLASKDFDKIARALRSEFILSALHDAFAAANQAILAESRGDPRLAGMATTAVCALIVGEYLYLAWVGDSSCFVFGKEGIRRVTREHTEVQRLIDAGLIGPKEALHHPLAHTITRFLGSTNRFAPDTAACRLEPGDLVLVCSDGLTDVLDEHEIAAQIGRNQAGQFSFDDLPRRLVRQALDAGTTDNVSVLCCQYRPPETPHIIDTGRTLTGAYPLALAKALNRKAKENRHVQQSLFTVKA